MRMCSRCNKNMAVIFVTKMENGKEISEGLCFSCAKQMGIKPFDKLLEQFNINEEDFADMNEQLTEMMDGVDMFGDNMTMGEFPAREQDEQSERGSSGAEKKGFFGGKKQQKSKRSFLDSYGTNLNHKAKNGEIDNAHFYGFVLIMKRLLPADPIQGSVSIICCVVRNNVKNNKKCAPPSRWYAVCSVKLCTLVSDSKICHKPSVYTAYIDSNVGIWYLALSIEVHRGLSVVLEHF